MSEWNRAIKMAQNVIRQNAKMMPDVMGNFGPTDHPDKDGMYRAADILDALLIVKEQA